MKIRDFGFPSSDPRHYGKTYDSPDDASGPKNGAPQIKSNKHAADSVGDDEDDNDESSRYLGHATALYDFTAENPSELSFKEGQILNILHRQCAGWLVGEIEVEEEEAAGGDASTATESTEPKSGETDATTAAASGRRRRKTVVKVFRGLVPENYVQIWGA